MAEYTQNGARLGWLLDPIEKRVYVYRPHRRVECLDNPDDLSGELSCPDSDLISGRFCDLFWEISRQ